MGSHPQDQQAAQQSQNAGSWGMPTSTHTPPTQFGFGAQPAHTPPTQYPQMPQQPQMPVAGAPRFPVINPGKLG